MRIKAWKDLVNVFLKHYKFNLETALDKTILMAMEKKNQESVRAYVQRWRDKATHVQPPQINTEMVMLFATTFQSPYYEHLIGSSAQYFHEVVRIAKRIEQVIKMGKIEGSTMNSRTIRTNESEDDFQLGNLGYVSGLAITSTTQMSLSKINIPLPLEFVYQYLLDSEILTLTLSKPMQPPFSRWYDLNQRCDYHNRVLGHSFENYKNFMYQVRKLVSKGQIEFVKSGGTYHIVTSIFNNN